MALLVAFILLSTPFSGIDIGICHLQNEHDFEIASNMHFSWYRSSVAWASIEIRMWGYDYYWKEADELVNQSVKYGINILWHLALLRGGVALNQMQAYMTKITIYILQKI